MAGQKKRKLAHILNLGNWANKKKKKLPQVAPTDEGLGVIPAIASMRRAFANPLVTSMSHHMTLDVYVLPLS
jgi:hypothetical protein